MSFTSLSANLDDRVCKRRPVLRKKTQTREKVGEQTGQAKEKKQGANQSVSKAPFQGRLENGKDKVDGRARMSRDALKRGHQEVNHCLHISRAEEQRLSKG